MPINMPARYHQHLATPSDIQHHLPLLRALAQGNVLELGTRSGVSTVALLAGVEAHGGHVWSVDLDDCSAVAAEHPQWTFVRGSSTDGEILGEWFSESNPYHYQEDVFFDLILIDTEHTYEQARAELALWGDYLARGGIVCMHDTETFPGVRRAAQEFADARGWSVTFVLPCHGMAVITRPNDG